MYFIDNLITLFEQLGYQPGGAYFFGIVVVLYGLELLQWAGCIVFILYCLFQQLARWLRSRREKAVD